MNEGDYIPPSGNATRLKFKTAYTPPGGNAVSATFEYVLYHPPAGNRVSLKFSGAYAPPVGNSIPIPFTNEDSPEQSSTQYVNVWGLYDHEFGVTAIRTAYRDVVVNAGISAPGFGTHAATNTALGFFPVGIPPVSAPKAQLVAYRVRGVSPYGIFSSQHPNPVTQNWVRYLTPTGADHSFYGTAVITRGVRSLAPTGINAALYGTASIDNKTRYYNLIGWTSSVVATGARIWDGKQYATNVTLGDGMFVANPIVSVPVGPPDKTQFVELSGNGMPIPDNQVWPLHKIENKTKQAFAEGFTSYGLGSPKVEQTIYLTIRPLGADWSVFGTAFVDQTIKKLFPESFSSDFVPASHQIYDFRIDVVAGGLNSFVSGAHAVLRGTARPVVPSIAPTSVVSSALRVEYRIRNVAPTGFVATLWGTAILQNRNIWAYPGGIAPPSQSAPANSNRQIPNPTTSFRVRSLTGAGDINTNVVPNTHIIAQWVQYVDLAARGIAPGPFGNSNWNYRNRTIYPTFILGPYWGVTAVKRRIVVEPTGWDSAFISDNAELLINTRRIYYYTGEADQAEYGVATVFNWRQDINLHNNGWYDTQWNFPVVANLKREIVVAPFANNVNPDEWPNYFPFVDNKDRALGAFGHQSSRVGLSTWIHNAAEPVYPVGLDATLWGSGTFIAYRNRAVLGQGWDSFYNTQYTVVWNKAVAIGPAGVGDTSAFGRPNPVENLNRTVKHHSGWVGPEWGVPFIAFARRSITPGLFYDIPASFPEVRHNPFPITPVGIPWQGQVGAHELMVFRREALPKSINVHSVEWVGEATVRNRNITVGPYGYDQSLFGRASIQNLVRYVAPEWVNPEYFTPPLIGHRTRTVYAATITIPAFPVIHRVRNDLPDPPSQQRITLNDPDGDGEETETGGFGIRPPGMPTPTARLATIYPESIYEPTKFGTHKVHSNNITVGFIFEDGLLGVPVLIFTRIVYPPAIPSAEVVSRLARMTPWNIYAPGGDQTPTNYTPTNSQRHVIGSRTPGSSNGSSFPWFGDAKVSNQHRGIGPVPQRGVDPTNGFDYFPKWGSATFTLRRQYVVPTGIRSLRFGQVIFLNVPQYVNLDDDLNRGGIAPSTQWGGNVIHYPAVQPSLHRPVYPVGFVATLWSVHRVELLNRAILATGIPHRGNPQQNLTSPWGTPLVGYPRRYTIGMGVQTLWGNALIEFKNRPVYPVGWNNCSLEDGNFEDYRFPMKVVRKNPPVRVPSLQAGEAFGTCTVSQLVRTVYFRGVDSYNSGSYSVKAFSTIGAQGWESLLIGDIDRWEAGKIKAHGDDMSTVGTPRLLHPLRPSGFDSCVVATPSIARCVSPVGIPYEAFSGPSVTNPFGCTNRVVIPLPVLSTQTVPSPVVV